MLRVALALAVAATQPASAQTYPTQNVNVMVAFAAGGIADVHRRAWSATKLGERFKHTVVVENRGGAGGNIAARPSPRRRRTATPCSQPRPALAVNETASKNKGF